MEHTPGPWHVEGHKDCRGNLLEYKSLEVRGTTAKPYHDIPGAAPLVATTKSEDHGRNMANARLIAAAPDMLEALKEAGIRLEASESRSDNSFARQIKSIIASAEGEA